MKIFVAHVFLALVGLGAFVQAAPIPTGSELILRSDDIHTRTVGEPEFALRSDDVHARSVRVSDDLVRRGTDQPVQDAIKGATSHVAPKSKPTDYFSTIVGGTRVVSKDSPHKVTFGTGSGQTDFKHGIGESPEELALKEKWQREDSDRGKTAREYRDRVSNLKL